MVKPPSLNFMMLYDSVCDFKTNLIIHVYQTYTVEINSSEAGRYIS